MLLRKFVLVLVALTLVLGVAAFPAASPALAATCTQYHTVRRGETLFSIGLFYGLKWTTLADMNNIAKPRLIFAGQRLCVSTSTRGSTRPSTGAIPTFSIVSVDRDKTVTIQTANLPARDTFQVTMGAYGTRGVGGTLVETVGSKAGGTRTYTFNIPAALAGSRRIAIRMESPTSGFFAFNWFWNNTAGSSGTGGENTSGGTGYTGFPTFSIVSVVRNSTVTIQGYNFPKNDTFNVTMGYMGTRGVGGISAGTYASGAGGTFTATFNIPAGLAGQKQIAIRLQSPTSGYFAYNWFWNQ